MKIFDFNIHLPYITHDDVNIVIDQDMNLDVDGIQKGFDFHKQFMNGCEGGNILLFNTRLFTQDVSPFFKKVEGALKIVKYTALIDFRNPDVTAYIDNLVKCGVHAIMFNSYLQQISETEFAAVLSFCKYAQSKGLIICIDGSYGTSKMYVYDNLKLACFIADNITKTKIVIVHAGGYRVVETMLLAADKKNVWLDTSFSLPYYENSSIENDFAYVIKKLECKKVVFGSDHPYIKFDDAINIHYRFFKKYNFDAREIECILYNNAITLFE
jgi:predicted TIM-barrel fold metal-dependent hydrolase